MKIYHNPRCRKSREALEYLQSKNIDPEIILYLNEGLNKTEIKDLLAKLKIPVEDLIRKNEQIFKDEIKGKGLSEAKLIQTMIKNPKLLQRPIIIKGKKAVIGRPVENIDDLL